MSCGVGHRCGLDLMLLWLWYRLAGVARIGPLAWEPPYATSEALKSKKKKKREREKKESSFPSLFHSCHLGILEKKSEKYDTLEPTRQIGLFQTCFATII